MGEERPIYSSLYAQSGGGSWSVTAKDVAEAARQGDAFAESLLTQRSATWLTAFAM